MILDWDFGVKVSSTGMVVRSAAWPDPRSPSVIEQALTTMKEAVVVWTENN
jgi:hypothetical protein